MQIYSGSYSQNLAQKIASKLNLKLSPIDSQLFPNGEIKLQLKEDQIDKKVAVVQSFTQKPNRSIIEFCLLVDALKRNGAEEIIAIIPWMGYCIQDKVFRSGEPLSARVIADIIQATKVNKIITVDLHNETIQGFFSLPLIHLSATNLFVNLFKNNKQVDCLVAPDVGALKENTLLAHAMDLPMVVINKKRDLETGKVKIISIEGQVKGKNILIMDDFISTGSTLIQAAEFLKKQQVAKITVAVTHHLFVPGVQKKLEESHIDELYITNTIDNPKKANNNFLKIISVADLIADKIS